LLRDFGDLAASTPFFEIPVETRVALTYAAVWLIALAAWQAERPELTRSPRLALAPSGITSGSGSRWEEMGSALSGSDRALPTC